MNEFIVHPAQTGPSESDKPPQGLGARVLVAALSQNDRTGEATFQL